MAAPTATAISAAVLLCAAAAFLATIDTAKAAADDLVVDACANVTNRYHRYRGPGLTRDSFEMALWSDKRSASAKHPRDLALVAMALVQEGAAVAGARVAGALSSGGAARRLSKDAALSLRYCRLDYEAVARTVPVCREMVQEYDQGHGNGDGNNMIAYNYLDCANRVIDAASDSWPRITFDYETKKAVWKEVNEVASRANLAKAMVERMVGVEDDSYATNHFIDDDDDADDDISHRPRHDDEHHDGGGADDDHVDDD